MNTKNKIEHKTICPVLETSITPFSLGDIEPLIEFLQLNQELSQSDIGFPVGTITHDGKLDLCKQNLGPDGASRIIDALKQNRIVKHLLLGTNSIGDKGAEILSAAIQENSEIETLYLGCNKIESKGAISLYEALEKNNSIKSVWLKRNPIGKESVPALINLLKKNKKIRTLDLVNTCLDEGFFDFFDYLIENDSLERLYLSGNYLTPAHLVSLANVLTHNKTIKALFLSVNNFGDDGATSLAKGLARNSAVEELSVASCGICSKGIINLIDALSETKKIKQLDLGYATSTRILRSQGNQISDEAAEILWSFIQQSPHLTAINLVKTNLSDKYKRLFANYIGKTIIIDGAEQKSIFPPHPDSIAIKSVYR